MSGKKTSRTLSIVTWKKGYPISIIFGTIISGTTGHQMTVQYIISPNVCFYTTWGKQNQWNMSWNGRKYVKKHPQHYRLWLEERLTDFNNFWCKHFWHYLPRNDCSSSHLTKCLLLHYLGKPQQVNRIEMQYFVHFVSPNSAETNNGCGRKLEKSFNC